MFLFFFLKNYIYHNIFSCFFYRCWWQVSFHVWSEPWFRHRFTWTNRFSFENLSSSTMQSRQAFSLREYGPFLKSGWTAYC
jgi:hypothetical protein